MSTTVGNILTAAGLGIDAASAASLLTPAAPLAPIGGAVGTGLWGAGQLIDLGAGALGIDDEADAMMRAGFNRDVYGAVPLIDEEIAQERQADLLSRMLGVQRAVDPLAKFQQETSMELGSLVNENRAALDRAAARPIVNAEEILAILGMLH